MKWYLIPMFFFADGSSAYLDGWAPRVQPSQEICEERREFMYEAMKATDISGSDITSYKFECRRL